MITLLSFSSLNVFILMVCYTVCQVRVTCVILDTFSLTGALPYADDVVLLAPTPSAMHILLNICEEFGK